MAPAWLEALAGGYLAASVLTALLIVGDLLRRPQTMWIMNVVWPVTALYWGPATLWAYRRMGRQPIRDHGALAHAGSKPGAGAAPEQKPFREQVAVGVMHCGAGCTLGDIAGEWLVFATGATLFGGALYADYAVDFALAFLLGIVFQYFSIAPMRGLGLKDGIIAALKADTISLVAFEVGLFAWMAIAHLVLVPRVDAASATHWFMMQIGMVAGFFTSYPANWWLIRRGLKEAM